MLLALLTLLIAVLLVKSTFYLAISADMCRRQAFIPANCNSSHVQQRNQPYTDFRFLGKTRKYKPGGTTLPKELWLQWNGDKTFRLALINLNGKTCIRVWRERQQQCRHPGCFHRSGLHTVITSLKGCGKTPENVCFCHHLTSL